MKANENDRKQSKYSKGLDWMTDADWLIMYFN